MGSVARADLLRWTGLAAGVAAAVWATGEGPLGLGAMLAPTLLGGGAVVGALAADATAPRPSGAVRTAALTQRRIRDFVPRRSTVVLLGFGVVLVTLLVVAAAVASPDDMGRAGRSFAYACGDFSGGGGPWPGSYYGLPLVAALAVATVCCLVALRRMARRPGVEESWRRAGASQVVAAWGLLVTASLAGVALAMAGALRAPSSCGGFHAASLGLGGLTVVSGLAATVCCAFLCRRG